MRPDRRGFRQQYQGAPIEDEPGNPKTPKDPPQRIVLPEPVDDVQGQSEADDDHAHADGGQHQMQGVAFQWIAPEGQGLERRYPKITSIEDAEHDAGETAQQQEQPRILDCGGAPQSQGGQATQCQDGALPRIPEHHPEHQDVADGHEQGGLQLPVFGQPVGRHQA